MHAKWLPIGIHQSFEHIYTHWRAEAPSRPFCNEILHSSFRRNSHRRHRVASIPLAGKPSAPGLQDATSNVSGNNL